MKFTLEEFNEALGKLNSTPNWIILGEKGLEELDRATDEFIREILKDDAEEGKNQRSRESSEG